MRYLCTVALCVLPAMLAAQKWGVSTALSQSVISDGFSGGGGHAVPTPVPALTAGVVYRHQLAPWLAAQPELHFSARGQFERFRAEYVSLPLTLRVWGVRPGSETRIRPVLAVGMAPALFITCRYRVNASSRRDCDDLTDFNDYRLRRFDVGAVGAIGLEVRAADEYLFVVEARGERGLRRIRLRNPEDTHRGTSIVLQIRRS